MKLASLLNSNLIFLEVDASSKKDAIKLMVDAVNKEYSFELDREDVFKTVMEREKLGVTTFKTGISIPHIRLKIFDDFILSFCVPKVPIEENGIKIKMIVLIIASHSSPHLHLNTLSAMAQLGDSSDLFDKLVSAGTTQEFIQIFDDSDFRVKKELLVKDIMSKDIKTVQDDLFLKDVVNLMNDNNTSYVPVKGANNQIVGEISILDIIGKGIPDYALQLENISFLSTMGPFEDLLKSEDSILIKEIMKPLEYSLEPEQTFLEAAYLMVKTQKRNIPVIHDGELQGVVSFMNVLHKVLRG